MSVAWCHERLDEMCARVAREASAKADRVIADMSDFTELPWRLQRQSGFTQTHYPYSRWEMSRIIFPRIMADLDALIDSPEAAPLIHA